MSACLVYRGRTNNHGYGRVPFGGSRPGGKGRKDVLLHRWLMEQVLGRPLLRTEIVRHTCDNPPCFRFDHLLLGTQSDNMRDMVDRGRGHNNHARGERVARAKLTAAQVSEIRALLATTSLTSKEIGRRFGVAGSTIRAIRIGTNWRRTP